MKKYDCVVIGAGPAGSTAAYHLSKLGRSVLLLDAKALPRYKPCGGGVSPAIAEWFDFDFSPVISTTVNKVSYTWNLDKRVEVAVEDVQPLWMVRRDSFDHHIVKQAQKLGTDLKDGTEVNGLQLESGHWQISTSAGNFQASYVIGADGAKGPTARFLGMSNRSCMTAGAVEAEASALPNDMNTIHIEFGLLKRGYLWNFPKHDGSSVGAGVIKGGAAPQIREALETYAKSFDLNLTDVCRYGHPLRLWDKQQPLHTENALLAGEAACLVDPLTAEGIRPSIHSGMEAAFHIHKALSGETDALQKYSQVIAEKLGNTFNWSKKLSDVFCVAPGVIYDHGVTNPRATYRMFQILAGELSYSEVAEIALKRLSQRIQLSSLIPYLKS